MTSIRMPGSHKLSNRTRGAGRCLRSMLSYRETSKPEWLQLNTFAKKVKWVEGFDRIPRLRALLRRFGRQRRASAVIASLIDTALRHVRHKPLSMIGRIPAGLVLLIQVRGFSIEPRLALSASPNRPSA